MSIREFPRQALLAGVAICSVLPAVADAALIGTLSFDQPTGTATGADPIPVHVTFTYQGSTEDPDRVLAFNRFGGDAPYGIDASDLPTGYTGNITHMYLNAFWTCDGSFTAGCETGPPYDFDYAEADAGGFSNQFSLAMNPGETLSFLAGTFLPSPDPAPAGTYAFYNFGLTLNVQTDTSQSFNYAIASTCEGSDPACAFTRVVTPAPVPLPAAAWLMLSGLAGVAGVARRRRRVAPSPAATG